MANPEDVARMDRYANAKILALRCRLAEETSGTAVERLIAAVRQVHAMIGPVDKTRSKKAGGGGRQVTLYVPGKGPFQKLLQLIKSIEGVEIAAIQNELDVHERGAIRMVSRMPIRTVGDLRMLYTPGVASACEEIEKDRRVAWDLTGICDRIAIVTNGTAVLGLGDIGALPSLPVMEGKAAILAEFADVSGVPVLVETKDVDVLVETVVRVATGFGAIQLEDIAAPACFEVEEKLRARLDIPVFHDDQHGTAVVVLASLISALKRTGREPKDSSVLILGAGAAGCAIARILLGFGLGDIVLCDSVGPLYHGRMEKMNRYKQELAEMTNRRSQRGTLGDCFVGKDIFIGVSRPKMVSKDMIGSMAHDAIVLPLSNPVGEIDKEEALEAGAAIAADGRDINNALAYPGIFRGALDARAPDITPAMELAAAKALAELASPGELLPEILDKKVHRAVAQAVMDASRPTAVG
jgi:malate dehydrogenase (oxaloacetate-decarboxylating)